MNGSKSTTTEAMGRLKVKPHRQNCVDIQNNTPQYLGVRTSFAPEVQGDLAYQAFNLTRENRSRRKNFMATKKKAAKKKKKH
jgi:hypothetical protein